MVDSDILIETSRGRNEPILNAFRSLMGGDSVVLYSPISAAEIWAGVRPGEFEGTARLFEKLECVPTDHATGELAGEFLRRFSKSHGLEVPDAIIAASAVKSEALLWTCNRKHYPMPEISFY